MTETSPLSSSLSIDTTDFKAQIASANRELRVLESGFRASAAPMGDWSKTSEGLELRIRSLNEQMDVQKRKVGALRDEFEKVAAEKGKDSKAAQELEIKLNAATETMHKMERELRDTNGALDEMGNASQTAGKQVDDLAGAVNGAGAALAAIPLLIQAIIDVIKGVDWAAIGSGIVDGIKNGFMSMWESFKQSITDKWNELVGSIKGLLGIHSPSTVFAGIGENMALGMGVGFAESFESIKRNMAAAVGGLEPAMQVNMAGGAPALAGIAGQAGMQPISISINASVASDMDIERLARKLVRTIERRRK